jgi:hypothetical protein
MHLSEVLYVFNIMKFSLVLKPSAQAFKCLGVLYPVAVLLNILQVPAAIIIRAVIITLMMAAASTSETSVNFYQTTQHYNPVDSYLHTCRLENLKSYLLSCFV